jgi:hypothetical protein
MSVVIDSMVASMIYFELDGLPAREENGYACSGYIFCRLDLSPKGLRALYDRLIKTSSWFLSQGSLVPCVQSVPCRLPPFKRRIQFRVEATDEVIAFSIRGITSTPKALIGFPTTLEKLIENQMLNVPFRTVDYSVREKSLPAIPQKRGGVFQHQDDVQSIKKVCMQLGEGCI